MGMNNLKPIEDYPDISFIGNYTIEQLESDMVAWFKEKHKEITGEDITLAAADDRRILLQTGAFYIFQGYMYSDDAGKMGLLKYSRGSYLENLGALKHIERKKAMGSSTTIRWSVTEARNSTTVIPAGTRVTAGDGVYFATDEYGEILPGATVVDIGATCTIPGTSGNNYDIGDITTIVDPVPYIDAAQNITKPENGSDVETDSSLRMRIYAAPAAYSTAGTEAAYEYFVREFNREVSDIRVASPSPCVVRIMYLLKGGVVPGQESIDSLKEYLSQPSVKPLTDRLEVGAPETVPYVLNVKYYINVSDRNRAESIQSEVQLAIGAYKVWQRSKMG
ncbi:MAG: baseplate J/gp47 family protein, partial [Hungatella sp.]